MFVLGTSWIVLSKIVRRWLTLRLYRSKIVYDGDQPYLAQPLTALDKAVIFGAHLFVLGILAAAILAVFVGGIRLVYG